MDATKRRRLLGWLFILGPTISLILVALGWWLLEESTPGKALQRTSLGVSATGLLDGAGIMPNFMFAAVGWLLLTLGCSAGTCLYFFRRRGKTGRSLVVFVALGAPLLAFAQVVLALAVVCTGCIAIFGEIRS